MIAKCNGVIQAIGKHVITQNTLAGGGVGISIDESAQFGIVITGPEVIEGGFSVLGLATSIFVFFEQPPEADASEVRVLT